MPTIEEVQTQARDYQTKALDVVVELQDTVVEYVEKAVSSLTERLPEDRPEVVGQILEGVGYQAGFAKQVLDSQNAFMQKLIDASVKPLAPAKKRSVKAA